MLKIHLQNGAVTKVETEEIPTPQPVVTDLVEGTDYEVVDDSVTTEPAPAE